MMRAIVRVQVDQEAKAKLDELCADRGMTQVTVMSRMVKWLVEQNALVQASVLGLLSEQAQADVARQMLERMADTRTSCDDPMS